MMAVMSSKLVYMPVDIKKKGKEKWTDSKLATYLLCV